jgi:phenylacetate-CoA ligase
MVQSTDEQRNPIGVSPSARMHSDLKNSEYVSWRRFLHESDAWNAQEIAEYQFKELRRILAHAYTNTSGYRELFEEYGVRPDDLHDISDLSRFPFVTKELIRDQLNLFSTTDTNRSYVTTGGSTGIPFGFYRNHTAFSRELASKAHQYARVGWQEGDRQLVFRGLPLDSPDHIQYVAEFEELRCSSYHLTDEQMRRYYEAAIRYRPEWIRCYPSTGTIFADFLIGNNLQLDGIKGVLCASENLYDWQKARLQQAFGGRVFSHYGHYELAVLAGFCEYADYYHVLPQYGYAELLAADGHVVTKRGEVGEVVGTSFFMTNTPFVRYRTRDFAVLDAWKCDRCNRPYQIWRKIEGRLQEFIVTGLGRYISMTAVNMHDETFEAIRQFQFFQEQPGKLVLRYIPKISCSPTALSDLIARLRVKIGDDVELELKQVDDIPLTGRGKHRFLVQMLPLRYGD